YFSHRFKHTTTAVIWNISFAAVIWLLIPFISVLLFDIMRLHAAEELAEMYMDANPFVQGVAVIEGTIHSGLESTPLYYSWIQSGTSTVWTSSFWIFVVMLGYVLIGCVFVWWTCRRLRKRIL
ncbi:MAG: hypothetical protein JXB18_03010, partial [Sedimentisphaerales bacterium]|nr:hypothetical protein [Sedimentisphaerales bacterium]